MSCLGKLVRSLFGQKLVEDRVWMEVVFANNYALFMGYLSMAVKGLGFLVLTWTTVVLLGGFVSDLREKDFWCLTFITLVQTAGIFDVFLTEKLSNLGYSFVGYVMVSSNHGLGPVLTAIQAVVFVILLCPLVAVYMFGLLISMGVSVWRLRQHDYGSGRANLKPALDVLYSLALLQGVIFCYKVIFGFAKGSVVEAVLVRRDFIDRSYSNIRGGISEYFNEMIVRCEKDPSSATGRNLITYAVDLMESKSPDDYLSGVRILGAFAKKTEESTIDLQEAEEPKWESEAFMENDHVLMKHLIIYASSTDILKKLLQMLGYRSIYDIKARVSAARIVSSIAEDISLEEFPRGIHYVSSLIDTFKEYHLLQPYQRDLHLLHETYTPDRYQAKLHLSASGASERTVSWNLYRQLMVQGFHILRKLATNDNNCRVMLNTPCLLTKIMAPLTSDLLHHVDHDASWSDIVEDSLKVIAQLMAATGQTGNKLRSEISSSNAAINTMERILGCDKCNEKLQKQVIWILSRMYMDSSLILETANREEFIEMLVDLMIDDRKAKETKREAAAMALVTLSYKTERSATIIMKANDNVVDNLTAMIVQKHKCRLSAAQFLEYLCIHYTDNDERLRKLQKTMTDAVPKVLKKIVFGDSQGNARGNNSSSSNQRVYMMNEYEVIHMLSLCVTVCDTFINSDQDLVLLLAAIAPRNGSFSFPKKLKEIVVKNRHLRQSCLTTVKLTCKMVISMMNHRGSYVKEHLKNLMHELSNASKEMFLLDGSMAFDITHNDTTPPKPFNSLASLVKEAQELVDKNCGL